MEGCGGTSAHVQQLAGGGGIWDSVELWRLPKPLSSHHGLHGLRVGFDSLRKRSTLGLSVMYLHTHSLYETEFLLVVN